ncbi:MAG: putative sulfate exporter family transporter [Cetobacterium sp.]|nr:putative sulfate exporter family transporter [Cetobacterium sp.]
MKNIKNLKHIIPGFLICTLLAYIGIFLSKFIPSLGPAPLAIFLGMFAGNTFATSNIFEKGSKFSEGDLLSYSIVLLGGTLSIHTLFKLGFSGIIFIVLQMILTISVTLYIGKKLEFSSHFQLLMASGNAVCGSSAIGATSPIIKAQDRDKGLSITIVNLTGTILMFLLIPIAKYFFNFQTMETSALLGGILQSVGQVIAGGSMINEQVLEMATLFKLVRIIFLVFVVVWMSKYVHNKNLQEEIKNDSSIAIEKEAYGSKSKITIPWYITGFFILCFLHSANLIPQHISSIFKYISGKFEIIALAGIGMRVKFKELISHGPKASIYGLLIGTSQIIIALILIKTLNLIF